MQAFARPSVSLRPMVAARPLAASRSSFLSSGFQRLSLAETSAARPAQRGAALVVEANAKKSMGCTLGGTQQKRARTSGFRARMASKTGRKVLAARRKRGRKVLVPASQNGSPKK